MTMTPQEAAIVKEGFSLETAREILADPAIIRTRMLAETEAALHNAIMDAYGVHDYVHHEVDDHGKYGATLCGEELNWYYTDRHGKTVTCSVCINEMH